jgi:hypothetical protein
VGVNIFNSKITGLVTTGKGKLTSAVDVNDDVIVAVLIAVSVFVVPTDGVSVSMGRLHDVAANIKTRIDKPNTILCFITISKG